MESSAEHSHSAALEYYRSDKERITESSIGTLSFLSYSHIGSSHVDQQKPNQDYSDFQQDTDTLFVTVGDGLGSCPFSDEGSRLVTCRVAEKMRHFVVNSLTETAATYKDRVSLGARSFRISLQKKGLERIRRPLTALDDKAFKAAFVKSIEETREELDRLSAAKPSEVATPRGNQALIRVKQSKEDFATTCLFVVTDGKKAFCSHIGDGGIYLVCQTTSELLLEPTKGDALNETIPITHPEWQEYLRVKELILPQEALFICLMTDGFAENISKENPNLFFQEVIKEAKEKTRAEFMEWLRELNEYYESTGLSDDDKTVSFIFFNDLFKDPAK